MFKNKKKQNFGLFFSRKKKRFFFPKKTSLFFQVATLIISNIVNFGMITKALVNLFCDLS